MTFNFIVIMGKNLQHLKAYLDRFFPIVRRVGNKVRIRDEPSLGDYYFFHKLSGSDWCSWWKYSDYDVGCSCSCKFNEKDARSFTFDLYRHGMGSNPAQVTKDFSLTGSCYCPPMQEDGSV